MFRHTRSVTYYGNTYLGHSRPSSSQKSGGPGPRDEKDKYKVQKSHTYGILNWENLINE